jgi:hypothetical protein
MFEPIEAAPVEIDRAVRGARSHWEHACRLAGHDRIELYLKLAHRMRADRRTPGLRPSHHDALEAGLAIRAWVIEDEPPGFAAVGGVSVDAIAAAVTRAGERRSTAAIETPAAGTHTPEGSFDLDPQGVAPVRDEVGAALDEHPSVECLEFGETLEILIGPGGWLAARRRRRTWLKSFGRLGRLVAQRGYESWQQLFDGLIEKTTSTLGGIERVVLTPTAAAPIVSALVSRFFVGAEPNGMSGGSGWTIIDEPQRTEGLGGGRFDDAGFPTSDVLLAKLGTPLGRIWGPGSFWRRSFREPPVASPSNLVMPSSSARGATRDTLIVGSASFFGLGSDIWVMGFELPETTIYVQLSAREWLERMSSTTGRQRLTFDGPVIPGLIFERLPL